MTNKEKESKNNKSSISVFFDEVSRSSWLVPILAIFSGLLVGGLIVMFTTDEKYILID